MTESALPSAAWGSCRELLLRHVCSALARGEHHLHGRERNFCCDDVGDESRWMLSWLSTVIEFAYLFGARPCSRCL